MSSSLAFLPKLVQTEIKVKGGLKRCCRPFPNPFSQLEAERNLRSISFLGSADGVLMYTCSPRDSSRISGPRTLGLRSTPFPTETGRGNESGQKPEPTIIWWLVVSLLTSGATITPNLPPPVFQLSMTNEHFGNSFRHTHNPLF